MKKAYLVEYCIRTRVVIDDNGESEGFIEDKIILTAKNKLASDINNYLIPENVAGIVEDEEVPYDPELDESEDNDSEIKILLEDGNVLKNSKGQDIVFNTTEDAKEFIKHYKNSVIYIAK